MAHAKARAIALMLLAVALAWPLGRAVQAKISGGDAPIAGDARRLHEWPIRLDGRELRPLALSDFERRFARGFPGAVARFTDGHSSWVLREVERPTRMLHPATDCYRAIGYSIDAERLASGARGLERCFVARRGNERLEACEQIVDAQGRVFTDASAWYWAALLGRSAGPWRATTRATVL